MREGGRKYRVYIQYPLFYERMRESIRETRTSVQGKKKSPLD